LRPAIVRLGWPPLAPNHCASTSGESCGVYGVLSPEHSKEAVWVMDSMQLLLHFLHSILSLVRHVSLRMATGRLTTVCVTYQRRGLRAMCHAQMDGPVSSTRNPSGPSSNAQQAMVQQATNQSRSRQQ